MNQQGLTVFIDPSIEQLVERLIPEKTHRPLISGLSNEELFDFLTQKRKDRLNDYSKAKITISGDDITEQKFLKIIKEHV